MVLRNGTGTQSEDSAVILTHSYKQDRALLRELLPQRLRYLGILGPLHRTERLVRSVAPFTGMSLRACMQKLHSPVGLDFGSGEPSAIALAIISEIQACLLGRAGSLERRRSL